MKPVTKMWVKRDGTKIRICDMEDSHLQNSIKMIDRQWHKYLEERGVGYALFQNIEDVFPAIKYLKQEQEYRQNKDRKPKPKKQNDIVVETLLDQLAACLRWEPDYEECGPQFPHYDYAKAKKIYNKLKELKADNQFTMPEHFKEHLNGKKRSTWDDGGIGYGGFNDEPRDDHNW